MLLPIRAGEFGDPDGFVGSKLVMHRPNIIVELSKGLTCSSEFKSVVFRDANILTTSVLLYGLY